MDNRLSNQRPYAARHDNSANSDDNTIINICRQPPPVKEMETIKNKNCIFMISETIQICAGRHYEMNSLERLIKDGGGALGSGCVQEEIRFSICPEMLVSLLVCEMMEPNECIFLIGCERYSQPKVMQTILNSMVIIEITYLAIIQLMAASEARRPLIYAAFGDINLVNSFFEVYDYLDKQNATV
ncbi:unnamed protein product [Rotaria sp. Silwood2]|nr:unnamed protein product [Rotaria sp. Silwood2]